MAKIIRKFNMDFGDMAAAGGNRSFTIEGDAGAIFSLEVKNEDSYYYNFTTASFSATESRLKQKVIGANGSYTGSINFPSITDNDQYDIYLWAEAAYDTEHVEVEEIRFGDNSLDINSTTGSNSNLVQKVIYQYTDTTITIYPWQNIAGGVFVSWIDSYVADTVVVGRGKSLKTSFSCTVTTGATEAIRILRQPETSDFFHELPVYWETSHASAGGASTGNGPVPIQGENPWAEAASHEESNGAVGGQTRGATALNMGSGATEATKLIVDSLPSNTQVGDRLTGWEHASTGEMNSCSGGSAAPNTDIVLVTAINPDGDNANEFSVDTALSIANDFPLYFSAPYYYRYKTKASLSAGTPGVLGLTPGVKESVSMKDQNPDMVASDGGNRPNTIAEYEDSTSYTLETLNSDGSINEQTIKHINTSYPAIDITGIKPTITNGLVTAQDGVITFTNPQKIDTAVPGLEGNTWFLLKGLKWVKEVHNTEIIVSNLKVELTKPITYTTGTVSDNASIAVADREGTIANVSTVSGIGIGISHTDTVDGAITSATKIVMDNNVAGHMKAGDVVTGIGIPKSSAVTVVALNPDGDNVKEFSVSESVTIADGTTLTFRPQSLPVITSSTADGAGSWTVDRAQTLESGTILTVENTGRVATITGDIEIIGCGDSNFNLILNVPGFITGA